MSSTLNHEGSLGIPPFPPKQHGKGRIPSSSWPGHTYKTNEERFHFIEK